MLRFEFFKPQKHYEEICKWWVEQKWDPIPLSHLPENGIVVYSNDVMACAGWIYKTDSAFCLFDWIVANPEIRKTERSECLNLLTETAKVLAERLGFKSVFITTKNSIFISRLEKLGFVSQGESMTNLIFNIYEGV